MPCLSIKTYVAKNVINKGKKTIPVNNNENFMSNFPFVLKEIAINNIHVYWAPLETLTKHYRGEAYNLSHQNERSGSKKS